jgi:uncharacterized membrane protein
MSEEAHLHLIIAAFDIETGAEEALKSLKGSQDEEMIGIQAAVALHKDEAGQIHFKDVGLTPAKGVVGGVVLGAAVGILTGGTGLALGALGALVGGLVGKKKRDSRFSADRINQVAASLAPGSSAAVIVMETGWGAVVEEKLALLGGDVLMADLPADLDQHLDAGQEAAYATLLSQVKHAKDREDDS